MEIIITGIDNNRPHKFTYEVAGEELANAVAEGSGWFRTDKEINLDEAALLTEDKQFVGLLVFFDDPRRGFLCTTCQCENAYTEGANFKLYTAIEINRKLDYT